jgi:hypothetical protein
MNENLQKRYSKLAFMQLAQPISVTDLEGVVQAFNNADIKLYGFDHPSYILGKK